MHFLIKTQICLENLVKSHVLIGREADSAGPKNHLDARMLQSGGHCCKIPHRAEVERMVEHPSCRHLDFIDIMDILMCNHRTGQANRIKKIGVSIESLLFSFFGSNMNVLSQTDASRQKRFKDMKQFIGASS